MVKSTDLAAVLDCELCNNPFTLPPSARNPCILPSCGHIFCRKCLSVLHEKVNEPSSWRCPVDQKVIDAKDPDSLPPADLVLALIRYQTEGPIAHHHHKVSSGGQPASKSRSPPSPGPENEDMDVAAGGARDDASERSTPSVMFGPHSDFCPEHKDDKIRAYCDTCELPVCASCVIFGHRSEKHTIMRLSEAARKAREGPLKEAGRQSEQLSSRCEATLARLQELRSEIEERRMELEASCEAWADSLVRAVEERRTQLVTQLHEASKSKEAMLQTAEDEAQARRVLATGLKDRAEAVADAHDDLEVVKAIPALLKAMADVRGVVETGYDEPTVEPDLFLHLGQRDADLVGLIGSAGEAGALWIDPRACSVQAPQSVDAGREAIITVMTADRDGRRVRYGGARLRADVEPQDLIDTLAVEDRTDGSYNVRFVPKSGTEGGKLSAALSIGSNPLGPGQPLAMRITPAYHLRFSEEHRSPELVVEQSGEVVKQAPGRAGACRYVLAAEPLPRGTTRVYWKFGVKVLPSRWLGFGIVADTDLPKVNPQYHRSFWGWNGNCHRNHAGSWSAERDSPIEVNQGDEIVVKFDWEQATLSARINRRTDRMETITGIPMSSDNVWRPIVVPYYETELEVLEVKDLDQF